MATRGTIKLFFERRGGDISFKRLAKDNQKIDSQRDAVLLLGLKCGTLGLNVLVGSRVKSLVLANNGFVILATGTTQKITRLCYLCNLGCTLESNEPQIIEQTR